MENTIYGLSYDYVHQQGFYLIFSKPQGIHRKELNDLQVKMLRANSIPKQLPIEIEEVDFKVKLRYTLTAKRLLEHALKGRHLTLHEYYLLLSNIVSALVDSSIYMLKEEHYLLDEHFIYIGHDVTDVYLTYLPIIQLEKEESIQEQIKSLALRLIPHVQELHGDGFQQLMNVFEEDTFTLMRLKEKLKELIQKSRYASQDDHIEEDEKFATQEYRVPVNLKEDQYEQTKTVGHGLKKWLMKKRARTIIWAGVLISLIISWGTYLSFRNEGYLYVSIGMTILAIDALYVLFHLRKRAGDNEEEEGIKPKKMKEETSPKGTKNPYADLVSKKTLLSSANSATVVLNEADHTQPDKNEAYFEVDRSDRIEKIPITENKYVIGRGPSVVSYIEDTVGVSRAHFEVLTTETEHKVIDLGSKNGTHLNDQLLIPTKAYILRDGDVIRIAQKEYRFKKRT